MKIYSAALATVLAVTATAGTFAQAGTFSDKDKSFLKDMTADNLGEIKVAELVVKTTRNAQIKQFASKMITDHRALIASTKPVAAKAGVELPTTASVSSEATFLKLKVLTGDAFDKGYVKSMVSDHHDDATKVKEEHDTTQNASMKALTMKAGPVIEGHTRMIDAMAGKMGLQ